MKGLILSLLILSGVSVCYGWENKNPYIDPANVNAIALSTAGVVMMDGYLPGVRNPNSVNFSSITINTSGNQAQVYGIARNGTNGLMEFRGTQGGIYTGYHFLQNNGNSMLKIAETGINVNNVTASSITAQMEHQFSLNLSTPAVGNIITRVAKSSYTLLELCAYAGVPPAGANMTITVTTGTSSGNASWLTGTSLGTLTIVDGKIQSNTLTLDQYIAKDSGMVRFAVTQIGSTANNTGFDVCITALTKW